MKIVETQRLLDYYDNKSHSSAWNLLLPEAQR